MGSVAAHSSKVLVSAWDGIERKGVGVGFSVFCKFCLGTMSMLHLELMFSSDVFKSKHTEEFGVQVGMTRLTADCPSDRAWAVHRTCKDLRNPCTHLSSEGQTN